MKTKELFDWVIERQAIYRRRESGAPKPWTKDVHLQVYKFCNVFRQLDKTTVWLMKKFYKLNSPRLPFAAAMARSVNLIETLEEVGFPETWSKSKFVEKLKARQKSGRPMVTAAYIISPGPKGLGMANHIGNTLENVWKTGNSWVRPSVQETHESLCEIDGIGPFVAHEIVTDLMYTKWLKNAPDRMTWVNVGPGSKRGLNRVFERPLETNVSVRQALDEMMFLLKLALKKFPKYDPMFKTMELRTIEDCLCEFDKYQRVKSGEGSTRELYEQCNPFTEAGLFRTLIMEGRLTNAEIFSEVTKRLGKPKNWFDTRRGYVTWYRTQLSEMGFKVPPKVT